ncbi:MAG TPA: NAD(P)-dependent oxidoreductase [Chloroflexota bacterium]
MRVLVTGGCGLVGAFAVRQLLAAGHEPVVYDLAPGSELLADVQARVPLVHGDLLNLPDLLGAARDYEVRRILHMASILTLGADARPYAATQTNVLGTLNVFEAVRTLGLERAVFCSTGKVRPDGAAYARQADLGRYDLERDVYTHTKIAAELLLSDYRQIYGLDLVIARFCGLVYGPGRAASGGIAVALRELTERPLRGEPTRLDWIPTARQALNGLLYARDAADGAVRATLAVDLADWVFNVQGHSLGTLADVAAALREAIPGARIEVPPADEPGALLEPDARAREQLGYVPRHSLRDGLGEYVEFARTGRLRDWQEAAR